MTRLDAAINIGLFGATMLAGFLLAREAEGGRALAAKLEICNATKPDAIQIQVEPAPETPQAQARKTPRQITHPDMTTLRVGDTLFYASGELRRVLSVAPTRAGCWEVTTRSSWACYARYGTDVNGDNNVVGVVR